MLSLVIVGYHFFSKRNSYFFLSSRENRPFCYFTANKLSIWISEGRTWLSLSLSLVSSQSLFLLMTGSDTLKHGVSISSLSIKTGGSKNNLCEDLGILLMTHSAGRTLPSRFLYWRGCCGAEGSHPVDTCCKLHDGYLNCAELLDAVTILH